MTERAMAICLGIAALFCVALVVPVSVLTMPAQAGEVVLVIAPPWSETGGAAEIVAALSGRFVGPVEAPFGVLAVLDAPDLAREYGAWLVLDGRLVAQICGLRPG
ncbi:hypothetical protein V8J82_16850 [Gymnodinialimonas sp. 2305UL16-5]|uniref:hypothetical protein n=1 Tax=Gymnodinialimonas mytili TaxID=3126503 RepID=UPI00309FD097